MPAKITDKWLKSLRAADRKQEFRDATCPRLFVVVQPLGSRPRSSPTVAFQFRVCIGSRDYKRSLGRYPSTSYAVAREAAWSLSREVDGGGNPFTPAAPVVPGRTVTEAFDRYMAKEGGLRKTATEKRAIFGRELVSIHSKPVGEVTRAELRSLIAAKDETHPQAARKLLAVTKRFFEWCVTRGEDFTGLEVNPAAKIAPMSDAVSRDRRLDADELSWLVQSLPRAGAQLRRSENMTTDEFPVIYELLLRLLLRKEEVFGLTRGMVHLGTGGEPEKLILPDTKGGRAFAVWLPPSAARLLAPRLNIAAEARVFRARPNERPLNRVRAGMDNLAAASGRRLERWSLHDFRQTGNDTLAAMLDRQDRPLVSAEIRERLLNHADASIRARNYESHDYFAERKRALKLWNDHLDRVTMKFKFLKAA